jgi:hypothetical protein
MNKERKSFVSTLPDYLHFIFYTLSAGSTLEQRDDRWGNVLLPRQWRTEHQRDLFHLCITEEFCCSSSSPRMESVSSRILQRDDADAKNDLSEDDNHQPDGRPLMWRSLTPLHALSERFSSPSDTAKNFILHQWRGHPSFCGVVANVVAGKGIVGA